MDHLQSNSAPIHSSVLAILCACIWAYGPMTAPAQDAELAHQLFEHGVGSVENVELSLQRPLLYEQPLGPKRLELAQGLADRIGWERFSADSVFAPVVIQVDSIADASGKRLAHDITCQFIVHTSLDKLRDKELMQAVLLNNGAEPDEPEGSEVPAEVLEQMQISTNPQTSYGVAKLPLLNRVQVSGVVRAEKQNGSDWLGIVWQFDPRFDTEPYSNTWQTLSRNNLGEPEVGPPHNYVGCGGYIMVHQLEPDSDILLIESRIVMHEPTEWFNGRAYLRSKLPSGLQENARSFRRKIAKIKDQ